MTMQRVQKLPHALGFKDLAWVYMSIQPGILNYYYYYNTISVGILEKDPS